MTSLGKILAILNVVAALAFVVLMLMVVGQRNAWEYTTFLHQQVIEGAPPSKEDPDADREATLDDLFRPAREKLAQDAEDPKNKETEEQKKQRIVQTLQSWARADKRSDVRNELGAVQNLSLKDLVTELRRPLSKSQQLKKVRPLLVVKTQDEEVKRWRAYLLEDINARQGDAAQKKRLRQVLVPLAETLNDRIAWAQKIDTAAHASDLLAADGPFEKAFALPAGEDNQRKSRAIARLLFTLGQTRDDNGNLEDPSAGTRAIVVVGLKAYAQAAEDQARSLRAMAVELRNDMYLGKNSERAQFIRQHEAIVAELKQIALGVGDRQYTLTKLQAEQARLEDQVRSRNLVVMEYQDKLKKAETASAADRKKQAELEKQLFNAYMDLARTAEENVQVEREIRKLEGLR
jgi:hypothetical protein